MYQVAEKIQKEVSTKIFGCRKVKLYFSLQAWHLTRLASNYHFGRYIRRIPVVPLPLDGMLLHYRVGSLLSRCSKSWATPILTLVRVKYTTERQ